MEDRECIDALIADGKPRTEAVSWLYRKFASTMHGYFMKHGLNREAAQDAVQDVFANVVKACSKFRGDVPVAVWVWTIARNRMTDHYRRQRDTVSLDESDEDQRSLAETLPAESTSDDGLADCVHTAMLSFIAAEPERGHALYLLAFEEWSIKDIAALLGRTLGATREYLSQCRKRIEPFIKRCHDYLLAD